MTTKYEAMRNTLEQFIEDSITRAFELSGVFTTDSSINSIDIPGVTEWAEQEAIKRIEGKK